MVANAREVAALRQVEMQKEKEAQEKKKAEEEAKKAEAVKEAASSDKPLIVAVTACTTGIAHTYMAEEALIKKGKKWVLQSALKPTGHLVSATA